jgi:hypothetical protein
MPRPVQHSEQKERFLVCWRHDLSTYLRPTPNNICFLLDISVGEEHIHHKGGVETAMMRLLKASLVGELTVLAAVLVALTGTPEKVLAQDECFDQCGTEYEDWITSCEALYKAGDYTGYVYCLEAADTQYSYCEEGCEI